VCCQRATGLCLRLIARVAGLSWPSMVVTRRDGSDVPACPLLGLAADRRSHFSYAHPGHRCLAQDRPVPTDASRQAAYCLSLAHTTCDRYPARQVPVRANEKPQPLAAPPAAVAPTFRVHVFRVGESLPAIAADHGLTADQIALANGLSLNDSVADGARLVIPLGPASSSYGSDP
jgi:LysM repeat protein